MPASSSDHPRTDAARAHPFWLTALLCALSAATLWLAFPPIGWWPLVPLAPALLTIAAWGAASGRRVFWLAVLSAFPFWMLLHRWMIDVTVVGWPALAVYLSIYAAVFTWLLRRLRRAGLIDAIPLSIVVPALWTALEFIRGDLWMDGYPWFLIGHPLIEWPVLAQSVDLFGHYFTSFLAALAGGALADVWLTSEGARRRRIAAGSLGLALTIAAANVFYGLYRTRQSAGETPGPRILAIQTNLPQSNKNRWTYEQQIQDVAAFIQITRDAHARAVAEGHEPDVIVWPETTVPGFGFDPETVAYLREHGYRPGETFTGAIEWLVQETGTPMLVGSPAYLGLEAFGGQWQWREHYNSAYLVSGDPPYQRYDKLFLTPFGETMPYISASAWLEQQLLDLGAEGMTFDLDPGKKAKRIDVDTRQGRISMATPICFEDAVAHVIRRLVWSDGEKKADLLINLSNDGWFGDDDGGRLQHVQIARFRCIENRVPMVRSVNTGLSVHIDSNGRIIAAAGDGETRLMRESGFVIAETRLDRRTTLYARIGDLFPWMCLAVMAGALVLSWVEIRGRKGAS